MRRLATLILFGTLTTFGCADDPETESMTTRTIELADSVDALLATLGGHMTDVLAADEHRDIRTLEESQWITSERMLQQVHYWIDQLADCVDADGNAPNITGLYALHDEAERTAIAHILVAIFSEDLTAVIHDTEIGYQIQMTNQMSALRTNPIYGEEVSEMYTCPLLPDYALEEAPEITTTDVLR